MVKTKKEDAGEEAHGLKPIAIIFYCRGCGQSKLCSIDLEKTSCNDCSRGKKCPKGKAFIFREDRSVKFSCCVVTDYAQCYSSGSGLELS